MKKFQSFYGIVIKIDDFLIDETGKSDGCYKLISVQDSNRNVVNFVISPSTYFVDHEIIQIGDIIIGFYNANAAVPLIFPPRFRAIVIARDTPYRNVKVDYFNNELINTDNTLKLNISSNTQILLENGQLFTKSPNNRNLIVTYGPTTRSIPAQTNPYKIIVMCS
ncbi:hypothetical protein KM792_13840 [Clostridium tyrobutyricum]|uniref:hypothetical protein n=1 Tax=Clostridium tyrobutyricum TaxID=1519 RepID=UPI00189D2A6F|nr:hypothetical protein [Clostridium tyrobutyricum]MBR9649294.1 hypothetical protein [Clostridium tyrobutyricum]MBV4450724.1 hypothetical protein [Clostridium tyrobutyricum]